eukprot:1194415-Pleurochrysis_carterae.AAC.3
MAHVLDRHTGQACTQQPCYVRHRELGSRSSSSLAARDDIRRDAMVIPADVLKLSQVEWLHM